MTIAEEKKKIQNVKSLVNDNQSNLLKQYYGNNNQTDLQKFYGKNSSENTMLLNNIVPSNDSNNIPTTPTSKSDAVDEWYNKAVQRNEQNRAAELEQNYVRQQLMEKYLPQDMKANGLSGSGLAELYKQKSNTDYMNNRALINSNYNDSNQSLLENYTNKKQAIADEEKAEEATKIAKEEATQEQNILDWYTRMSGSIDAKIAELIDEETGKLSEEGYNSLYKYIEDNKGNINSHYEGLLKNYLDDYKMNEEQISKYNEQKLLEEKQAKLSEDIEKISELFGDNYTGSYVDLENATISSFGKHLGTGKGGKQDKYILKVIELARQGKFQNGDLIDFNYGSNLGSDGIYAYYNGRFYEIKHADKTHAKYDEDNLPR